MTPQSFILSQLNELNKTNNSHDFTDKTKLIEEICRLILYHKFRKYSVNDELKTHIKNAVTICVEENEPIKIVFLHGAYKLWRLEEAPEVDWAELFSSMYYINWLKDICAFYKPGVWFDYFVDDLIIPKIDNLDIKEINRYIDSYQQILDFLQKYQLPNFKMTITRVGSQFGSINDFEKSLAKNIEILKKNPPEITEERLQMIELNHKSTPEEQSNPDWKLDNIIVHDAYLMTKREPGYHFREDKILAFSNPLPSGTVVPVGTTKATIAKFWIGVGALKKKNDTYQEYVLSPKQIKNNKFSFEKININGLTGKNFHQIRVFN